MKTIGGKLKEARECAGLSQEQVAEYLGVNQSLVSHWESESRTINLGALLRLCSLYGCPEEYFDPEEDTDYKPIPVVMRGNPHMSKEDLVAIANLRKLALNLREIDRFLAGNI